MMSLFVGGLMVFLGIWGMVFNGFLGLSAHIIYWAAFAIGGGFLAYFGYHDARKPSIITCSLLGLFFLTMGVLELFNLQINSQGLNFIMANYQNQGSADYLLSFIAAFFLFAGAFDWYRKAHNKPVEEKKFNPILK